MSATSRGDASPRRSLLRDNAFLVAAVALPVIVAGFFVLATAIPRWTVPPPAHDLVFRVHGPYDSAPPRVTVEFAVRDGQVLAVVRPAPPNSYGPALPALFLFEHESMRVRHVPLELPDRVSEGESREVVAEPLAGLIVDAGATAPDGYEFRTRSGGSGGLVGELFGMGRYRQEPVLVKDGRTVTLDLPDPYGTPYSYPAQAVGWVTGERGR